MRAFGRGGEALGFELVGELAELVEIDARPEAERMRYGLRYAAAMRLARFAEAGTDRSIDGLLERNALLARALLQESRKVIVDGERRAHLDIMDAT
ncbi:MAG TPA: hypothetical protein VGI22_05555 [Xanthobacteraceae bacterium]